METLAKVMLVENNMATISKYEVMEAFFKTEDNDDVMMADELNKLINKFYDQERQTRRNVNYMSFNIDEYKNAIAYIKRTCM